MKASEYIKKNWKAIILGYAFGVTAMHIINIVEELIIKIAILINN